MNEETSKSDWVEWGLLEEFGEAIACALLQDLVKVICINKL